MGKFDDNIKEIRNSGNAELIGSVRSGKISVHDAALIAESQKNINVGDVTYGLPECQYHGKKQDGTYVPIFIDSRIDDKSQIKKLMEAQRLESKKLIDSGFVVNY